MIDSADIRIENKNKICREFLSRKKYTKQQMAQEVSLSVATCNTLLNELEEEGKVVSEKAKLGNVGRSSSVYELNENFEYILCMDFTLVKGERIINSHIVNVYGDIVEADIKYMKDVDKKTVFEIINEFFEEHNKISIISIGVPGNAENGIIRYCDIPEIEEWHITEEISKKYNVPVLLGNDMHVMCYGYYKKECIKKETVTLGFFPQGVYPGTSTVTEGKVIRGANVFAGTVGFLPFNVGKREKAESFNKGEYFELAVKIIGSIIAILNPNKIILSGDLLNTEDVIKIKDECSKIIPCEYMPQILFKENIYEYYVSGLYERAIDKIYSLVLEN